MTTYKELLKQREALEQQISEARRRSASAGTKVAPKYRNPATGETWTGRGKAPKWIQNQDREQFAI